MCDGKCEFCKHNVNNDCNYDEVTPEDRKRQDRFDKDLLPIDPSYRKVLENNRKYGKTERGKEAKRRYKQSDKGKESNKRYAQSEKCREAKRRYARSEKGKETAKRKTEKKVASGKNAEYCKNYRMRLKENKVS